MAELVLITGGAGFVASHLADQLLASGYRVRALDNLTPQVHGTGGWPAYLDRRVERVFGDVRDPQTVREALTDVSAVFHFAAVVGVGQSMYQLTHYTGNNVYGTAVLLEALVDSGVERLIVASSMSVYGEGAYETKDGQLVYPLNRTEASLTRAQWGRFEGYGELEPIPTSETKATAPSSVYALNKYDQERLCLMLGAARRIPTIALRFFNIYGPRQALSNPYTGVLAIFAARLLNDRSPVVFEDGLQRRDFVSVHDVARDCLLSLESSRSSGVYNIGSGVSRSVLDVAKALSHTLGKPEIQPEVTGKFRVGDIRHCFADTTRAQAELGFRARVSFDDGLAELTAWLRGQQAEDGVEKMRAELLQRGLTL